MPAELREGRVVPGEDGSRVRQQGFARLRRRDAAAPAAKKGRSAFVLQGADALRNGLARKMRFRRDGGQRSAFTGADKMTQGIDVNDGLPLFRISL